MIRTEKLRRDGATPPSRRNFSVRVDERHLLVEWRSPPTLWMTTDPEVCHVPWFGEGPRPTGAGLVGRPAGRR
ncbi:hypothetical protein BN12_190023 [Nostocoides japonicum T1-X7]|uniref:Uncharacterized protein n=1 Tax=Nostocoides japonicum T1-X7 TaxID=1194083 RepID=A0A077LZG9_9MICO|nr:hypothetical protein BN12_190023 [Tetrasphaera japonica T1-X7]